MSQQSRSKKCSNWSMIMVSNITCMFIMHFLREISSTFFAPFEIRIFLAAIIKDIVLKRFASVAPLKLVYNFWTFILNKDVMFIDAYLYRNSDCFIFWKLYAGWNYIQVLSLLKILLKIVFRATPFKLLSKTSRNFVIY